MGDYNVITGYMAGDKNIVRSRTSLTGERVKDDPVKQPVTSETEPLKKVSEK